MSDETALTMPATEATNPRTRDIDRMPTLALVQAIGAEDATVAAAVAAEAAHIAAAIDAIAARLRAGGRLMYCGAGTSGRLGALDAYECPATFNVSPDSVVACIAGGSFERGPESDTAEDDAEAGAADLRRRDLAEHDAVVGIAASGRTPYVLGAIAYARSVGALTIGLACNPASPLAEAVEISIAPVTGPEVISGSTRLKAGTAQKMVLNMLSTGTMIRLGKTYGNLMVDVQTTNAKLRARAAGIIQQITGLSAAEAERALTDAHGDVKLAILMAQAHLAPEAARARLAQHNGNLRAALEDGA
jgi:N-acetylmuramic acid 6-phosphate etherase